MTKQETDYLQGYQHFVNKKTKDLRKIVDLLNEKNAATSMKDEKIVELEMMLFKLRAEAIRCEDIKNVKQGEVSKLKNKVELIQDDRRFLY